MRNIRFGALIACCAASLAFAADPDRGRELYDTHCGSCHSASVHGRAKRAATNFEEIRAWVIRWKENLALGWSDDEVDDVSLYLDNSYYRYPCPTRVCKIVSTAQNPRVR